MALSKNIHSKECLFQCGDPCTEADEDYVSDITKHVPNRWTNFEKQALLWKGLDRFGDLYDTVDWKKGAKGYVMHDSSDPIHSKTTNSYSNQGYSHSPWHIKKQRNG